MKKKGIRLLRRARDVLEIETQAISQLIPKLGIDFLKAVETIASCQGKVIVTGIGKSGLIGRKIVATLSSTGTPAIFLHPAEGGHGDLGVLAKEDVVLAISYSGNTKEINNLIPAIKRVGVRLIAVTGNTRSALAKASDGVLNVRVKREACPYNLIPTASTTATLAMGDALAIAVLEKKRFQKEDFALFHPAGSIGKKLILKVSDIMRQGKDNPVIREDKTVKEALFVMTATKLGAVNIVNERGKLVGYFTDGDLRRNLQKDEKFLTRRLARVMTRRPVTIGPEQLAVEGARLIRDKDVDNLPVVDKKGIPVGVLDEWDLLSHGLLEG